MKPDGGDANAAQTADRGEQVRVERRFAGIAAAPRSLSAIHNRSDDAGAIGGMMGVVLATSPSALLRGNANVSLLVLGLAPGLVLVEAELADRSKNFCCAVIAAFSASISFCCSANCALRAATSPF